jgi:hypothetical protein
MIELSILSLGCAFALFCLCVWGFFFFDRDDNQADKPLEKGKDYDNLAE